MAESVARRKASDGSAPGKSVEATPSAGKLAKGKRTERATVPREAKVHASKTRVSTAGGSDASVRHADESSARKSTGRNPSAEKSTPKSVTNSTTKRAAGSEAEHPRFFPTAGAFRRWLEANASTCEVLLVGFHKVGSGRASMTWPESVDEALCFGWIDGLRKRIDDAAYQIRFSRRRAESIWSKVNVANIERLITEGRMRPEGLAAFARRRAHRTGVYTFEQDGEPNLRRDELAGFRRHKAAWSYWQGTPPGYRRTALRWILQAKRVDTRARRLARLIEACAEGKRLF